MGNRFVDIWIFFLVKLAWNIQQTQGVVQNLVVVELYDASSSLCSMDEHPEV